MNRIDFMTQLAALLQDISIEERREAMKYYNDYFDDAGMVNEQQIIEELGSPAKVAAEVKAGLKGQNAADAGADTGEYRETGYTDTRFENKEVPTQKGPQTQSQNQASNQPPRTSNTAKILLIILIVLVGAPILLPLGFGIICVVLGIIITAFFVFISLVIASVAVAVSGIFVTCVGIAAMIPELAAGMLILGCGLLLTVVGVIATVASIRLCIIVFPGMVRGIVWVCRRPFQHRKVVA